VIVQKLMDAALAELLQRNSPALGPPTKMFSDSSVSLNHFERVAARAQIRNEAGQNYGKMAGRNAATGCSALGELLEGGTRQNTLTLHNAAIFPPTASPSQIQLEIDPPQSRSHVPVLILGTWSSRLRPVQATPRTQDVGARPAHGASLSRSGSGGPQRSEEDLAQAPRAG
jgi:hypothetical protein